KYGSFRNDRCSNNLVRLRGWIPFCNFIYVFHAFYDLAPQGILSRELAAGRAEANEELAVGAVRIARARHSNTAALVLLLRELRLQIGERGATGAGAGRIARLGQQAGNHTVKDNTVVEAL